MFGFNKSPEPSLLDRMAAAPIQGSPVVAVLAPKGGGSQTTTAVGLGRSLAPRMAGMVILDDWNPDKTTMLDCLGLGQSMVPKRIMNLSRDLGQVRNPSDWGPYLDRVGRIHVAHNQDVTLAEIATLTLADYQLMLDAQRRIAAVSIIDVGTSIVHPACRAALQVADKLVVACAADPKTINVTKKAIAELFQSGHERLIRDATVVVSVTVPGTRKEVWQKALSYFQPRVRSVVLVPFDRALSSEEMVSWDSVKPRTTEAMTATAVSVMEVLHERYAYAARAVGYNTADHGPEAWPALQVPTGVDAPTEQNWTEHPADIAGGGTVVPIDSRIERTAPVQDDVPDWALKAGS